MSLPTKHSAPNVDALPENALLTRNQLVALTGFFLGTLKKWEKEKRGPAVLYIEGRPRTTVRAYHDWLAEGTSQPSRKVA